MNETEMSILGVDPDGSVEDVDKDQHGEDPLLAYIAWPTIKPEENRYCSWWFNRPASRINVQALVEVPITQVLTQKSVI